jgi:type I restriction enzyme S subunit
MKSGWQTSTLGDVLAVLRNGVNCKQDKSGKGDKISRIESISDASFDLEKVGYAKLTEHDKERCRLQPGDILFSHINSAVHVGKTAVFDSTEPVYHGVNLLLMRPKDVVTAAYLEHALKFLFQSGYWRGVCKQSVNQASVNQQDISQVEISYPKSLPEQQRIVGILDEAFAGIATAKANAEKNLQNARALFESHLQSVFTQRGKGWVEKRLGDLSRINYGYTESASAEKVGPHFLRITDIQDNRVDWVTVPYCPIDASDLPKYKLADGDIVFARTGATTGKSYLVTNPPEAVFASYLIRVQLSNRGLLPQFLNLFFQTHTYWDTIRAGVSGSAQGGFNATKLGELVIPFPESEKEQKQIIAKLDGLSEETQRLASLYEHKLVLLEALKKSLLHQAFTGQL